MKFNCNTCNKKTPHKFIQKINIIRVVNRSGKRRFGLFLQHNGCVLRESEYHLYSCSIYRCLVCGKEKKLAAFSKKISRKEAELSGLAILNNLGFWHFIYR